MNSALLASACMLSAWIAALLHLVRFLFFKAMVKFNSLPCDCLAHTMTSALKTVPPVNGFGTFDHIFKSLFFILLLVSMSVYRVGSFFFFKKS